MAGTWPEITATWTRRRRSATWRAFVDAGITTFDCADIYTGVEELIGRFRREHPDDAARLRVHTEFVPDLDELGSVDRAYVERIVDRSLQRLGVERLDLVQFHWWDYSVARYVEVALELERLRRAGKIDRIGVTNFGTAELGQLLDAGVPVLTHQLQYSLLDDRPRCRCQTPRYWQVAGASARHLVTPRYRTPRYRRIPSDEQQPVVMPSRCRGRPVRSESRSGTRGSSPASDGSVGGRVSREP